MTHNEVQQGIRCGNDCKKWARI